MGSMATPEGALDGEDDSDGALYDAYLDGALAGTAEEPSAFFARHPGVSPEVRARIEAFHRIGRRREHRASPPAEPRAAEPGLPRERVGEFRLLRRIAAGGMGVVYEAEQTTLGRTVAVKLLRPDLRISPDARERFRREALTLARLRHPSIVPVLAAGEDDDTRWIAMELVPGRGLDEVIRDAPAPGGVAPARAVRWAARIARALEYASARGVIHRDVKPANILIGTGDEPFLLDFGVARAEEGGPTMTGPFVGSIPWAAPEQLDGRTVDERADIYGLGATLYHALVGRSPFEGGTVDRILHRALNEEPVPPGRLRAGIPRDLDAVVLRALEKSPDARYSTLRAFAEDLEALLEFRPVKARPPGAARRMRAFVRHRPALAAAMATACAALIALAGTAVAREAARREEIRREAASEVHGALARLQAFRSRSAGVRAIEEEIAALRELLETSWMTAGQAEALDRKEAEMEAILRAREEVFHGVLEGLRRAERLHPEVAGVEEVRARLYAERALDAEASRNAAQAEVFRTMAAEQDSSGTVMRDLFAPGEASLHSDAPGTEVHLFRILEESILRPGGERRLIPVPLRSAPIEPGTTVLRVARGAGPLRAGDLVLEVDGRRPGGEEDLRSMAETGGCPARVLTEGTIRDVTLPAGLVLRPTSAPVPLGSWSLAGTAPMGRLPLERGVWMAVFRAREREDQRIVFRVKRKTPVTVAATLAWTGTTPPHFARVFIEGDEYALVMDREVTCAEYLEFLDDPTVVPSENGPLLVPRNRSTKISGHWTKGADGRYSIADGWERDWPVLGVSYRDAMAYAAWRTKRDRPLDGRGEYGLPNMREWRAAGGNTADDRYYVFGDRMRPWWVKSCFARSTPGPESVLRFPRDESPYGVHDMAGSVAEWCDEWYDRDQGKRRLAGGSWAWGTLESFKIWGATGWSEDSAGDEAGFRLVLREVAR